jgi:hypothetical protein
VTVRHGYLLFPQDQARRRSSLLVKAVVGGDLAVEHARLRADKVTATLATPSIVELQPAACHKNMLLRPSSILRWLVAEAVVLRCLTVLAVHHLRLLLGTPFLHRISVPTISGSKKMIASLSW